MHGPDAITTGTRIKARAVELFRAHGVDATPLREIAVGLAVTKAALYYHFLSKDELLQSLVSPYLDDLGAVLLEHEERRENPRAGPLGLLEALARTRLDHADRVSLLTDPAVRRSTRLTNRIDELQERCIMNVIRSTGPPEPGREQAVAALGALDALTRMPEPARPSPPRTALLAKVLLG